MKLLAIVLALGVCQQAFAELKFESLGEPVRIHELGPQFVTAHPDGYHQVSNGTRTRVRELIPSNSWPEI